jgi:hypothetical protein
VMVLIIPTKSSCSGNIMSGDCWLDLGTPGWTVQKP